MTTTVYTPQVGDRVVVESPVFPVGDAIYDHVLRDAPEVGSIYTVAEVREDGYVVLSGGWASHVDAVLPLDDLDLIAAERRFPIGTKVRVVENVLADGTPGGLGDLLVGAESTVTGYGRYMGGVEIFTDGEGSELHPDAYVVVEPEPAEEATRPVAIDEIVLTFDEIRRGQALALATQILGEDALSEDVVTFASFILGEEV